MRDDHPITHPVDAEHVGDLIRRNLRTPGVTSPDRMAGQWRASWTTEATTSARDTSVMRNHVLKQWEAWPLGKIDHLAIQTWITGLSQRLSPATIGECRRLMSGVMRSAVRNRLIAYNPCEDIRVPKRRKQDHDDQVVARVTFQNKLLPAVPIAIGASSRWPAERACAGARPPASAPTTWTPAGCGW